MRIRSSTGRCPCFQCVVSAAENDTLPLLSDPRVLSRSPGPSGPVSRIQHHLRKQWIPLCTESYIISAQEFRHYCLSPNEETSKLKHLLLLYCQNALLTFFTVGSCYRVNPPSTYYMTNALASPSEASLLWIF